MAKQEDLEMKAALEKQYNCGNCLFYRFTDDSIETKICTRANFPRLHKKKVIESLIAEYDLKNVCGYWRTR